MNSSLPAYPIVVGREGWAGSQVSFTVCVRKSIQRRSAGERARAVRRDGEVMVMLSVSSRLTRRSLYLSLCWRSNELVEPTT